MASGTVAQQRWLLVLEHGRSKVHLVGLLKPCDSADCRADHGGTVATHWDGQLRRDWHLVVLGSSVRWTCSPGVLEEPSGPSSVQSRSTSIRSQSRCDALG